LNTVSAVFNALGWFHTRKWTQKEDAIENVIVEMIEYALKDIKKQLKKNNKTDEIHIENSTGGLTLELTLYEGLI